jgi:hypothetical protein
MRLGVRSLVSIVQLRRPLAVVLSALLLLTSFMQSANVCGAMTTRGASHHDGLAWSAREVQAPTDCEHSQPPANHEGQSEHCPHMLRCASPAMDASPVRQPEESIEGVYQLPAGIAPLAPLGPVFPPELPPPRA